MARAAPTRSSPFTCSPTTATGMCSLAAGGATKPSRYRGSGKSRRPGNTSSAQPSSTGGHSAARPSGSRTERSPSASGFCSLRTSPPTSASGCGIPAKSSAIAATARWRCGSLNAPHRADSRFLIFQIIRLSARKWSPTRDRSAHLP